MITVVSDFSYSGNLFHKLKVLFLCRADEIRRRKGDVNANHTDHDNVFGPVGVDGLLFIYLFS